MEYSESKSLVSYVAMMREVTEQGTEQGRDTAPECSEEVEIAFVSLEYNMILPLSLQYILRIFLLFPQWED